MKGRIKKYIPGGQQFMDTAGFEEMMQMRHLYEHLYEEDTCGDDDWSPVTLVRREGVLSEEDERKVKDWFRNGPYIQLLRPNHPGNWSSLSPEEIDKVLNNLQKMATEEDVREEVGATRQKIEELNQQRKTLMQDALNRCVYRIRQNIGNIYEYISPHIKIEPAIKLEYTDWTYAYDRYGRIFIDDQQASQKGLQDDYFLSGENRIVKVPLIPQRIWQFNFLRPDFNQSVDVGPSKWYFYQNQIVEKLISGLPLAYKWDFIAFGGFDGYIRANKNYISYDEIEEQFRKEYNFDNRWNK